MTTNLYGRWGSHTHRFKPNEYTYEILAKYNSEEELRNAEKYWIWRYKAEKEGYNKKQGNIAKFKYPTIITISIDTETLELFDKIADDLASDRSKLLRKWIKEHAVSIKI